MKSKSKVLQIILYVLPYLVVSAFFPFLVLFVLVQISGPADVQLTGDADGMDPAAVFGALLHVCLTWITFNGLRKREQFFAAQVVRIAGVLLFLYVFAVMSSLLWL